MWTIARVKDPNVDMLPEIYQTFQVMKNGKLFGTVARRSRPKNAGGPAWCIKIYGVGDCGMDVVFYHAKKSGVLEWVKSRY